MRLPARPSGDSPAVPQDKAHRRFFSASCASSRELPVHLLTHGACALFRPQLRVQWERTRQYRASRSPQPRVAPLAVTPPHACFHGAQRGALGAGALTVLCVLGLSSQTAPSP